ncbi:hypothetical protein B0T18DRAFT_391794 [Schizothecium vesticola]|uniref:Uncharacterized protein n=1 Tax=Schizothecium vesticola TaxID=314040 RepID=A0AA40EP57_9PEZI|nr:hypothetical protein B0T18DRAFT_391794 [Schizothecium vesticola]
MNPQAPPPPQQQQISTFRNETMVSAAHGNAAVSDSPMPLSISHHAEGVVLEPLGPSSRVMARESFDPALSLSSARAKGGVVVMASLSLEVGVAPHDIDNGLEQAHQNGDGEGNATTVGGERRRHGPTRITSVRLYAGDELIGVLGEREGDERGQRDVQQQLQSLPTDRDLHNHVLSDFYQVDKSETRRLNNNIRGLNVTLTVEFGAPSPSVCVSSVALVQTLRVVLCYIPQMSMAEMLFTRLSISSQKTKPLEDILQVMTLSDRHGPGLPERLIVLSLDSTRLAELSSSHTSGEPLCYQQVVRVDEENNGMW